MYDMLTVDLNIRQNTIFFYTNHDGQKNVDSYPFFISKQSLVSIGKSLEESRQYIPTSFQGSFDNVIVKTEGTRAVDWLDFLLYIVPTLVVPFLKTRAAQQAILALVKGCSLALQWNLTEELITEMDR